MPPTSRAKSFTNGLQGDASYVVNAAHTLRAGFTVSGEQSAVGNQSLVEPVDPMGNPIDAPFTVTDNVSKLGWLAGVYVQDEWKLTNNLKLNYGLRFDQMWQYVDANQLSPRASLTYKPFEFTTFHIGYARYFTPPVLVEAAPANIALFANTTGAPASGGTDPVLPERSHYFDAGVDQKIPFGCVSTAAPDCSMLELGVDAYYKIARDLLDNGTFGQALVLSAFNYAQGISEGIEFSAKYHSGNFQAYGNLAVGQEKATNVVSNQYLFDNATPLADLGGLTELQYIDSHWIYTDHNQFVTGSAGVSYLWNGTRFSADMIYGSGLRNGDANICQCIALRAVQSSAPRTNSPCPTESPSLCASTSSICSTRSTRSGTAAASACSRRNMVRAAAISSACRRKSEMQEPRRLTFGNTRTSQDGGITMRSCLAARTGHRLLLSPPLLLIFMSFAPGVAHGKASPFASHVTVLPPSERPSQ